MPRPSVMSGWWKLLLDRRASGSIALLAQLCGVTTRTLHRWQCANINIPDLNKRIMLQNLAGADLLQHPLCPKYLQFKRKVKHG